MVATMETAILDHTPWSDGQGSHDEHEDLLIVGTSVIWKTAGILRRAFDFAEDQQTVRQALFAYFPRSDGEFSADTSSLVAQLGTNTRSRSHVFALSNAFKSTANLSHTICRSRSNTCTERALVVILDELAYIYYDDGRQDLVNLPFRTLRAFSYSGGLLLERLLDTGDFARSYQNNLERVPRFFVLPSPTEEPGIICASLREQRKLELSDHVCFVTKCYLVTYNSENQSTTLWYTIPADEAASESAQSSWKTTQPRRRSSMRTSLVGLQKIDDFEDDRRTSSVRAEPHAFLDRVVSATTDVHASYNDEQNLRKDLFLDHLKSFPLACDLEPPRVFSWSSSPTTTVISIHSPPEESFLQIVLRKTGSSKPILVQHTRASAKDARHLQIGRSHFALLLTSDNTFKLRAPLCPDTEAHLPQSFANYLPSGSFAGIPEMLNLRGHSVKNDYLTLSFVFHDSLVKCMLDALQQVLPQLCYTSLLLVVLQTRCQLNSQMDEFEVFCCSIFCCFLDHEQPKRNVAIDSSQGLDTSVLRLIDFAQNINAKHSKDLLSTGNFLPQIVLCMHFVCEELALDVIMASMPRPIFPVMAQICYWLKWDCYVDYYASRLMSAHDVALDDPLEHLHYACPTTTVPSIHAWLEKSMRGSCLPFQSYSLILDNIAANTYHEYREVERSALCPTLECLVEFYTALMSPEKTLHEAVEILVRLQHTSSSLERLPQALVIPIRDSIRQCFSKPSPDWSKEALSLIGRLDMVEFLARSAIEQSPTPFFAELQIDSIERQSTVEFITDNVSYSQTSTGDRVLESEHLEVTRLLHPEDRRLQEATNLLKCHKTTVVQLAIDELLGEAELVKKQQDFARLVAKRTMAIPLGRAALHFNSKLPLPTERQPVLKMNFDIRIRPAQVTISEDKAFLNAHVKAWGLFHNGVSAGLSIALKAQEISASWIDYNKPEEFTDGHAGFLLGLGLNGHLKAMATWHAFNYLTSKHTMTSIGLLLGLSASFLGSEDPMITKLLSVHVLALLPPGSNELNLSGVTQAAGVAGIGLLYYDTGNRKMSEVMLREIAGQDSSIDHFRDESYRLSAGLSLGMINVGRGNELVTDQDLNCVQALVESLEGTRREKHDLDVKMAGAIVALGLIYLRTHDRYVAGRLSVPATEYGLRSIRPDLLLLRVLARGLVMWDEVSPTIGYVKLQLPQSLRDSADLSSVKSYRSSDLALFNVVVGVCLSIGMKYAGTLDTLARDFLLRYLDIFLKLSDIDDRGVDLKACKIATKTCLSVLAYSTSMVMAGSGDLQVLRRLRRLHYRLDLDTWYGHCMAVETSIGLLFASGGQVSLNTSNRAICAFVAAFYPVVPNATDDNKSHLQALRHLWVLGTEQRCLIPRDIHTKQVSLVPILITFRDSKESLQRLAPCLLPPLQTLDTITIQSSEHWPVMLDLRESSEHLHALQANQTFFITRRSNSEKPHSGFVSQFAVPSKPQKRNFEIASELNSIVSAIPEVDLQSILKALDSEEDWQCQMTTAKCVVLNRTKRRNNVGTQDELRTLLAWWNCATKGQISHKFLPQHMIFQEEFVQKLLLDLWKGKTMNS